MDPALVRAATANDVAEITRIYSHHVLHSTATFETEPPTVTEMATRREAVLALDLPYLVAEQNGTVIGFAYANSYRPRPAYRFTIEDSIYIDPRHTGKGCGSALLKRLIEGCAQGPWRQMIAVIGDSANASSIRLHQRFGFGDVGTFTSVGYKFERWIDTVLMRKELTRAGNGFNEPDLTSQL